MLTYEKILEILNREVRLGEARLKNARQALDAIITEVPGQLPHPDGQYRLSNAIREHVTARQAFEWALERHSAFTLHGVTPEDLK